MLCFEPKLITYWCSLLITFVNSLEPDQARLDRYGSKLFDTLGAFLKEFFKNVDSEKNEVTKKHEKFPSRQR